MKNYHTFDFVLQRLLKCPSKYICVFENRPAKYKFGAHNYGEIPLWYNKADGDPWDIFAPGYKKQLKTNYPYVIDKVIGVYILHNGNHKIAVRLKDMIIDSVDYEQETIRKYTNGYTKYTKVPGVFMKV